MEDQDRYAWTAFYEELANRLLPYKAGRAELIAKLQQTYQGIGLKLPRLDSTPVPADIDPFTVFGLFNKGVSDANRKKIVAGLAATFGVTADQPKSFGGVPVLNNLNATYYRFMGDPHRGENDIDNLWDTFELALACADRTDGNRAARGELTQKFARAYDSCHSIAGVGWKLSMGLYWIRPNVFLNLDSRNRWFLKDPSNTGDTVAAAVKAVDAHAPQAYPTAATYLDLCNKVRTALKTCAYPYKTFPELSERAWVVSQEVNDQKKNEQQGAASDTPDTPNALGDSDVRTTHYWLYAPGEGASMWDDFYDRGVMGLGWAKLGDPSTYASKEEIRLKLLEVDGNGTSRKNSAHAVWQFVHDIMPGDVIFAKRGREEILGRGVVTGDFQYDEGGGRYPNLREVRWTNKGSWRNDGFFAMKTLTDVTDYPDFVAKIDGFFEDDVEDEDSEDSDEPQVTYPAYTKQDFLREVYMSEERYDTLVGLLHAKKNVILQGAPGVGKTFAAKRLAYSMMGVKDSDRVMMVQFHQSYSYEDFIEGFRPSQAGFDLIKGSFYTFCKKAAEDTEHEYFFVIDEINRGNLSKIFGELFMLIEADKRGPGNKLQLLYSRELFYVPTNVYLVGMMNTADRSLAMLDFALRRRFAFFDLVPGFQTEGFKAYQAALANPKFDRLVACVERLNADIAADASLGEGFRIGHSYFCGLKPQDATDTRLKAIVEYELVPLLGEYWFDDPAKAKQWADQLRGALL